MSYHSKIMPTVEHLRHRYSETTDPAALRKQLAAEGYSVFSWQDAPGNYYSPHSHPHDEYIVVIDGAITFKIDGKRFELRAGDALQLPANTVHEAINEGASTVRYFICS